MATTDPTPGEDAGITLARYAASLQFEDLPPAIVSKVKELILDSIGVAFAGSTAPGIDQSLAAARLIELPFEGVLDACGIAYSQCAANMQPVIKGATIKRFHAGFAARNGVVSATLARHGLTGAQNWLEGRLGYYNL